MISIEEGKTRDHHDKEQERVDNHAIMILGILGTFFYRLIILLCLASFYISMNGETTQFVLTCFLGAFALLWMTLKHISDEIDKTRLENLIKHEPSKPLNKTIPTNIIEDSTDVIEGYIIVFKNAFYGNENNIQGWTTKIDKAIIYKTEREVERTVTHFKTIMTEVDELKTFPVTKTNTIRVTR